MRREREGERQGDTEVERQRMTPIETGKPSSPAAKASDCAFCDKGTQIGTHH